MAYIQRECIEDGERQKRRKKRKEVVVVVVEVEEEVVPLQAGPKGKRFWFWSGVECLSQ